MKVSAAKAYLPGKEPNNQLMADAFAQEKEIRSRCGACGEPLVGTMDELADHFMSCNGPG